MSAVPIDPVRLWRRAAPWLLLVVLEVGSQLALKAGGAGLVIDGLDGAWLLVAAGRPLVWLGVLCYVGAFATWMLILSRLPLGQAFPASAMVFVVVILASWLVFGEAIAAAQWLGFALILLGVFLL